MNLLKHARGAVTGVFDPRTDLPKLAIGGAWLFAVGSLLPLLWLIIEAGGGVREAAYVFQTHTGSGHHSVPLLAYAGWPGLLLIWAEVFAVTAAILFTAFPRRVPVTWQRIGHSVLVGWSALWALGAWRLGVIDPGFWTVQAMFFTALSGSTIYRARRGWTPAKATAAAAAPSPGVAAPAFHSTPVPPAIEHGAVNDAPSEAPPSGNYFEGAAPPAPSKIEQFLAMLQRATAAIRSRIAAAAAARSSAKA